MRYERLGGPSFQFALARKAPPLEAEQERALSRRWRQQRDRSAADVLIRAHLRTVTTLATKYRHYNVPLAELIAEGNCGLVHALDKFDPERGVRFATYAAHWVRAYILAYVLRSWSIVSSASGLMRSQMFFKVRRERARLMSLLGEGEAFELALAERLNVTPELVRAMIRQLDAGDVSLDSPLHSDSPLTLLDQLASGSDPEQSLGEARWQGSVGVALQAALAKLDVRERYIVETRLLADSGGEASLAQIGRHFGISRERARQIEGRAKRKLRAQVTASTDAVVNEWVRQP